jgi:hypothetical protein
MGKMDFDFVAIPDHLRAKIGEPHPPNTRMFCRIGREADYAQWWDAICEICGEEGSVSPGGVAMYAEVSRAGVHKRMKEGRITAFLFYLVKGRSRWTRREVLEGTGMPYIYIPGEECRAWAKLIKERATRAEAVREAVGDGDRDGEFMRLKGRKLNVKRVKRK